MEKEDFKVGDQVQLKSGSPTMTVESTTGDPAQQVKVVWWSDESVCFTRFEFPSGVLESVKE